MKGQLAKRGIAFQSLDNGISSCADPARMQRLADGLTAAPIEALLRKWLARLPHPFTAHDRAAGIRYDISVLRSEFALTQVFDRPVQGRVFFEEVLRENLDLGRPDRVQLIYHRRLSKRTPSRYRTRVITDGVVPSLHVDYKHSRIKQYHKEGRALRTEIATDDTYDFNVGRRPCNLEDLKRIGFAANRHLLHVPRAHRYRVTDRGLRIALCYQRLHRRVLCPSLAAVFDTGTPQRSADSSIATTGISSACGKANNLPLENLAQVVGSGAIKESRTGPELEKSNCRLRCTRRDGGRGAITQHVDAVGNGCDSQSHRLRAGS